MTKEAGFTIYGADGSNVIYDVNMRTAVDDALAIEGFITAVEADRRRSISGSTAAVACTDLQPDTIAPGPEPMLPGMHEVTGQLFDSGYPVNSAMVGDRIFKNGMMDD